MVISITSTINWFINLDLLGLSFSILLFIYITYYITFWIFGSMLNNGDNNNDHQSIQQKEEAQNKKVDEKFFLNNNNKDDKNEKFLSSSSSIIMKIVDSDCNQQHQSATSTTINKTIKSFEPDDKERELINSSCFARYLVKCIQQLEKILNNDNNVNNNSVCFIRKEQNGERNIKEEEEVKDKDIDTVTEILFNNNNNDNKEKKMEEFRTRIDVCHSWRFNFLHNESHALVYRQLLDRLDHLYEQCCE